MSEQTYVLGSDIGSGSCKTLLADASGKVIARSTGIYHLQYPHPGWAEYNPHDWYAAFCKSVQDVLAQSNIAPEKIACICIIGITHNPVLLDAKGAVLRPSIHFNDQRSLPQCDTLRERWGDRILERSTNAMGALWTYPQLLWIKENEPTVWEKMHSVLFPKDYVRQRLTGETQALTDHIDASGTLLFDPISKEWIQEFLDDLEIDRSTLPKTVSPFDIVGEVSIQGANDTGLHIGTSVIAGTTDTAAEILSAGALKVGQGTIKLASVGRIAFISEQPVRHAHILNYPYFENLWYPGSATQYGASAYRWLHESLWADVEDNAYAKMDALAAETPLGADGLIFLPHLMGQFAPYWNPKLSGAFLGVGLQHQMGHFTRAVLEGVAFALLDAFSETKEIGFDVDELFLIGNGARSPLWRQIVTDVMNRKISVPKERDAAYGAVLLAGMKAGLFPDKIQELNQYISIEQECLPNDTNAKVYNELFSIYQDANRVLPSISERLYDFRRAGFDK